MGRARTYDDVETVDGDEEAGGGEEEDPEGFQTVLDGRAPWLLIRRRVLLLQCSSTVESMSMRPARPLPSFLVHLSRHNRVRGWLIKDPSLRFDQRELSVFVWNRYSSGMAMRIERDV